LTDLERKLEILRRLEKHYADAGPELDFVNDFQLLVAVILSAQTTDIQVNQVTKKLFLEAPDPETLSQLERSKIEDLIKGVGLYRNKAKNLKAMAQMLLQDFEGQVPQTREELEKLPGVGRKTANVVLSVAFDLPALAVDTHVFRVANRTGLAAAKNPGQTESQLCSFIPEKKWAAAHHWFIHHGRYRCKARNPMCEGCCLEDVCPKIGL
jgi:endonuclease-3